MSVLSGLRTTYHVHQECGRVTTCRRDPGALPFAFAAGHVGGPAVQGHSDDVLDRFALTRLLAKTVGLGAADQDVGGLTARDLAGVDQRCEPQSLLLDGKKLVAGERNCL